MEQLEPLVDYAKNVLETNDVTTLATLVVVAVVSLRFIFASRTKSVPSINIPLHDYEKYDEIDAPVHDEYVLERPDRPGKVQCYDPATIQYLGETPNMTSAEVESVIAKTRKAQKTWRSTSFEDRRHVLRIILRYVLEHSDDICRVSMRDTGKDKVSAGLGETLTTCEKLRWVIKHGEDCLKPEARGGMGALMMHKNARVEFTPLGVIAVLAPWNYPYHNLLNHIISGIFTGNGVVCKPSEFTSWSADFIVRGVKAALQEAGHDPELVNVVTGTGGTGAALVGSTNIDMVVFTGSDAIGKKIMEGAAKNLTPVVLELGGKDPLIVCESADLGQVIDIIMRGVYQNCGQNCIGVERLFLHESLHDKVVDILHAKVAKLQQKVPLKNTNKACDLGAMTTPAQLKHVTSLVDDAVAKGATLVIGGKRNQSLAPGLFFEPTILTNVTANMRIFAEEVFGPVCVVYKWGTKKDVINMVNSIPYGLGSNVFSGNHAEATEIGRALDAGMLSINDFGVTYLVQSLPFGGVKSSGFGKFGGPEGLRALCRTRAICEDKVSFVKTSVPAALAYPLPDNATDVLDNLVRFGYADGMLRKGTALVRMLKGMLFG